MQLRKTCAHPFLFFWPRDANTREEITGKELVRASGKMMLLDRLLESLIGRNAKVDKKTKRPHKVLLFSQFTRMLDIIEVRTISAFQFLPILSVLLKLVDHNI